MDRPIKYQPPVEMKGIRATCLYTTFGDHQPLNQFYAGTSPYPSSPWICVD